MLRAQLKELRRKLVLKVHGSGSRVQGVAAAELREQQISRDWIDEGDPRTQGSCAVRSDDGRLFSGEWTCTAGRFRWTYFEDEIIRILDGEIFLEIDGEFRRFGPGATIFFPMGQTVRWHVPHFVHKAYFISHPGRFVQLLRTFQLPGFARPAQPPSIAS
jgi:uncharacterized protein